MKAIFQKRRKSNQDKTLGRIMCANEFQSVSVLAQNEKLKFPIEF